MKYVVALMLFYCAPLLALELQWYESAVGDAGDLPTTAQVIPDGFVPNTASSLEIIGVLNDAPDNYTDMYYTGIAFAPGLTFLATYEGAVGTQVILMKNNQVLGSAQGAGLGQNVDIAHLFQGAGHYTIGVTGSSHIGSFNNGSFSWAGSSLAPGSPSQTYHVKLDNIIGCFPEPSSLALMLTGFGGGFARMLSGRLRKKTKTKKSRSKKKK